MRTSKQNQRRKLAVVGLSIGAIFVCDWLTPRGYVVWILYLIPVLLAARLADRRFLPVIAAVCVALVIAGFFVSSPGIALPVAIFNRLVGVAVLWVAALLLGQRKRAEAALREREEQLRALIEHAPAAIAMFDREMKYVAASRRYSRDYQLGEQNLTGRSHYEVFPEIPERWKAIHRRCLAGAVEKCDEDPFPRADGRLEWVRWEIRPWHESTGEIGGIILFSEVITARKQAEAALREAHDRLAKTVATAPGVVCSFRLRPDGSACFPFGSERLAELYGVTTGNLAEDAAPVFALVHPDDLDGLNETIAESARRLSPWQHEWRVRHPVRGELWIEGHSVPLREADGSTLWHGVLSDITERRRVELERQKFFMLAESSSEFIAMCDLDMRPLYVNPAGVRMVGLPDMAAACRVKVQDYFFPADQAFIAETFFPRVMREGDGDVEIRLRHFQTGEPIWMFYYLFSVRDASGTPVGWATVSRNITERKQAEAALRESEARLRLAVQASNIGLWDWDLQTNAVYFSPEWKRQIGYRDDEIPNRFDEWQRRVHPDDLEPTLQKVRAFLNEPKGRHEVEFRFRHKDGSYRWIYTYGDVLRDAAGQPVRMLGCHIDITERKQAEETRRALTARLLEVREEERTGIARELHDVLGQALTGLKLDLAWLDRRIDKTPDCESAAPLREKTAAMNRAMDETIQMVRRISSELRPGVLDSLGLVAAVEWQAQEFEKRTGIACRATLPAESPALDGACSTALFRIFQEALSNVARHAHATRVEVMVTDSAGQVTLEIADDGTGIADAAVAGANSLGLLGMRERAAAVGGALEIAGEKGKGTSVVVRVPRAEKAEGGKQ